MSATDPSLHKFFEAKVRLAGKVGAAGVASPSATTIPHTFVGLDEGDAYVVTANRTDATGATKNPVNQTETFIGKVSSGNFIDCVRAVEGAAQAWAADTVLEILVTATGWNKLIEGVLVSLDETGEPRTTKIVTLTGTQTLTNKDLSSATNTMSSSLATLTGAQTLTDKRITKRVTTITSHATPTINTDNCEAVTITAQAEAITSMTTNLSGTPTNFQTLIIRIKDNATARAITWGASFEAKGTALPTTTVLSKVLTVGFIYDTVTSKWGCVASIQES